jgi:hypothetical protein
MDSVAAIDGREVTGPRRPALAITTLTNGVWDEIAVAAAARESLDVMSHWMAMIVLLICPKSD